MISCSSSGGGSGDMNNPAAFTLNRCPIEKPDVVPGVSVESLLESDSLAFSCGIDSANLDRIGTSSTYLAYNIICEDKSKSARVSFWMKGMEENKPFTIAQSWDTLPNISFLLESSFGKQMRSSTSSTNDNVSSIGGVLWTFDNSTVPDVGTQPDHRLIGCLEGEFGAEEGFKAGHSVVKFDVTMK